MLLALSDRAELLLFMLTYRNIGAKTIINNLIIVYRMEIETAYCVGSTDPLPMNLRG